MIYLERRRNYQKYVVPKKWFTEKVDWRRRAGRDKEWRLAGWLDGRTTHTSLASHTLTVIVIDIANVVQCLNILETFTSLLGTTTHTQKYQPVCWHLINCQSHSPPRWNLHVQSCQPVNIFEKSWSLLLLVAAESVRERAKLVISAGEGGSNRPIRQGLVHILTSTLGEHPCTYIAIFSSVPTFEVEGRA